MNVKILRSKYAIEGVRETGVAADDRNENEVVHAQDDLEHGERHERQEPVRSEKDVIGCSIVAISRSTARAYGEQRLWQKHGAWVIASVSPTAASDASG
jgi:hypothetical protein